MGCCSKKKKPAQGNTMNKSGDSSKLDRTNATQPRASGTPGAHGTTPVPMGCCSNRKVDIKKPSAHGKDKHKKSDKHKKHGASKPHRVRGPPPATLIPYPDPTDLMKKVGPDAQPPVMPPRPEGPPPIAAFDVRSQQKRESHQKALKSKDSIDVEPKEVKQNEAKEDKQKKEEKKKDKKAEINESEENTVPKFPEVTKLVKSKRNKDEPKNVPVPKYPEHEKNEKIEKQEPKKPESMESKKDKVREKKKKDFTSSPNDSASPLNRLSEAKSVPKSVKSASSVDNNDGAAKKDSSRSKYPVQKMTITSHVKDGMVISQWAYTEMRELDSEASSIADLLAGGGRSQLNLKG